MGNFCATDIYKEIKEANPEQFQKYILAEELKKGVTERVDSVKSKVTATADDIKKENLAVVDSKEAEVKAQFEKAKADLDKGYLGGVKALEQTQHSKAEDLLGYTAIQKKFTDLRTDVTNNFNAEKERVTSELSAIKKENTEKFDKEQPKLNYFETLGDKIKKEVYESGVKEYKDKIEAQSKTVLAPLQEAISPEPFINRFKNLFPVDNLKNLTTSSKNDINHNLLNYIGKAEEGRAVLG
jgi:hypothetical protein